MIGFDIDGCMNNIKEDIIMLGNSFFSQYAPVFRNDGYYLSQMFPGLPEELYHRFWDLYGYEIYTNPPKEYVYETIDYVRTVGIGGCIITTRDISKQFGGISFKTITEEWLKKYDIELPVYYTNEKQNVARSMGVTLMIEDKPANILKLQEVTDVLIYKHPYNQKMEGTFVNSWKEIFSYLQNTVKNK